MQEMDLTPFDQMLLKLVQLFDTLQMRNGIMLVGQTGTGKSTIYQLLKKAIDSICSDNKINNIKDPKFRRIRLSVCNPKSVATQGLYGFVNQLTNEWTDGIIGKMAKECTELQEDFEWLVFDG